jgi:hypothetical protein
VAGGRRQEAVATVKSVAKVLVKLKKQIPDGKEEAVTFKSFAKFW